MSDDEKKIEDSELDEVSGGAQRVHGGPPHRGGPIRPDGHGVGLQREEPDSVAGLAEH
jgi:hypothetical protein